jgi:predicted ATPase/DNA-binding winged helix-turn-helix (wHTH) protein
VSEANVDLVYTCEQWEVDVGRRELRSHGVPVPLGGRAFEIVKVLVQTGELVTKDHMMERVWPGVIVGEGTIHVHISAVRKALGADRALLKTVSGRGYRLVGNWTPQQREAAAAPAVYSPPARTPGASPANNFPPVIKRLIGRAAAAQFVRDLVSAYRVVTLTGPGGIGKTSLAIKSVRYLLPDFEDGGWIVELASLSDPALVPSTVARTLGLKLDGEISAESVAGAVGGKHLLLLLDNCEHVIDAVASLAEIFMRVCPRTTIVATSREVLRIDGESVYRVPPLDVPAPGRAAPDDILGHSAVELFVARAKALNTGFAPHAEDLASIASICRSLDGMPLAIEFAAARTAVLSVQLVAAGLRDRFALLTAGRRTALPRHRTLRATLDWSHELLPESERCLLRRVAVFPAGFTIDAAAAVMTDTGLDAPAVLDGIANLIAKSLVALDKSDAATRWILLETIRVYALEKLIESGEHDAVARLHAEYCIGLLAQAGTEAGERPLEEWLSTYGRQIDNVRKALDWAFSDNGDAALGLALTVGALPLWMHYSLMNECRSRVEAALSKEGRDPRRDMQLYHALGAVLLNVEASANAIESALTRALELAERLGDNDHLLRIVWCLWCHALNLGAFREGLDLARRFSDLAALSPDPVDALTGVRMRGFVLHFLGDQSGARRDIEHMISRYVIPVHRTHIVRFQFDQLVTARNKLVHVLWLQGFVDQARTMNEENIADACELDHAMTLCNALTKGACPFTLISGDLPAAQRFIDMLLDLSARNGLTIWHAWATCFKGILLIKSGSVAEGLALLDATLAGIPKNRFSLRYAWVIAEQADGLRQAGRIPQGLELIDQALSLSAQDDERWCVSELLRIKAELLKAQGGASAMEAAERCFIESLDWARRQGALSWELRTALGLYRLEASGGRQADALSQLKTVFARFDQGSATTDLLEASKILENSASD